MLGGSYLAFVLHDQSRASGKQHSINLRHSYTVYVSAHTTEWQNYTVLLSQSLYIMIAATAGLDSRGAWC